MESIMKAVRIPVAILMALCICAGCGPADKGAQSKEPAASPAETVETQASAEKVKIRFVGWTPLRFKEEGSWGEQCIEEAFPEIDMEFRHIERAGESWIDKLNTMIVSGDIPDVIVMKDLAMLRNYVNQGVLASLSFDDVRQYMPKYFEEIKQTGVDSWLGTVVNNKLYGLPSLAEGNEYSEYAVVWRKDWLDNVGLAVPDTLEEYEEAFKRFTLDDPDGNGKDDTYAMTGAAAIASGMQYFGESFFGAFGIMNGVWNRKPDGSLEYGLLMDDAKTVLRMANRWYENGYMDPEFITNDERILQQKQINGVVGYFGLGNVFNWWPEKEDRTAGIRARAAKKVNPAAEFAFGYPPAGPGGKRGSLNYGRLNASYALGVHAEKQDRKRQLIMMVLEKKATDPEFNVRMEYGMEGVHCKITGDAATGTYQYAYLPPYNEPDGWYQLSPNGLFGWSYSREVHQIFKGRYDDAEKIFARKDNVLPGVDYFPYIDMFVGSDTAGIISELKAIADRWQIEFVTGAKSIDGDWDRFVEEWNNAGGAELRRIINDTARKSIDESLEYIGGNMK